LGTLSEFIEQLSKHKLVGIFLLLWGLYFFFSALYGLYWVATATYYDLAERTLAALQDIMGLGIAGVLALLGLKILGIDILPSSAETQ
jgi:hypothetical protein